MHSSPLKTFIHISEQPIRTSRVPLGPPFVLIGLAFAALPILSCGGEEPASPVAEELAPESEPTEANSVALTEDGVITEIAFSESEAPLEITRATRLLPDVGTYDVEAIAEGRLPTGAGIWFTLEKKREKAAVDRHIQGFELIAQAFSTKNRDSRRAAVLRVIESQKYRSPLVRVPKKGTLSFSYMPYLVGMGGYSGQLDWRVSFEVEGKGGRATSVEIWTKRHVLRPPTGGGWRHASVELTQLAGRAGRLVFDAVPSDPTLPVPIDLVAVFANPMITPERDDRPNLLVISIDTLRKDAISPYGADPAKTPKLQSLADNGVVFDQFWSTAPWTLPAYASLFTAEYPSTHGAGADRVTEVEPGKAQATVGVASGIPSLVSHFRKLGYSTQSFYSNGHLNLFSGIDKGFDGYVWYGLTGETAVTSFHEWTAQVDEKPFFAFVQMTDPHWPYVVPRSFAKKLSMPETSGNESLVGSPVEMFREGVPEQDRQDMTEIYGFLVQYMDKHVGGILRTLEKRGLAENTLVVFHTDHGEEFWDHGEWWHGHTHHAELENVSLIFSWPGKLEAGARIQTPVRATDILPTAIDLMGLPAAEHETEGRSFAHLLRGEPAGKMPPILHEAELYGPGGDFALTDWPWRLLVQPPGPWIQRDVRLANPEEFRREEVVLLFNIEEDPKELNNLAAMEPEKVAGMRKKAEALRARAASRQRGTSAPTDMGTDADADDGLGVLGYTGDD